MWKRGENKNQRAERSGRRRENKRTGEPEIRGIREEERDQENWRTRDPRDQRSRENKRAREQKNWRTREPRDQRGQENWRTRDPRGGERTRELENQRTREYGKEEREQENWRTREPRDQGGGTAYYNVLPGAILLLFTNKKYDVAHVVIDTHIPTKFHGFISFGF